MSDKMREAFERDHGKLSDDADMRNAWERNKHMMLWAWHAAQSAAVPEHIRSIKIPTDAMEQEFQKHYRRGYEAGKSDAVPVVGDVVATKHVCIACRQTGASHCGSPDECSGMKIIELIEKPATSITAAELDALRKDAERYRWRRMKGAYWQWTRFTC